MSAYPIHQAQTPAAPPALRSTAERDESDQRSPWVPLDDAAPVLNLSPGALRRKCLDLQKRGLAQQMIGPSGRRVWHIHASHNARLLRVAAGAATPAQAASAVEIVKSATDAQRDAAMRRYECLRRFRAWRRQDHVEVTRDYPALRDTLRAEVGEGPCLRTMYQWDTICPATDDAAGCIAALLDQRGGSRGEAVGSEAWAMFERLYLDPRQWSIAKCHRAVKARAGAEGGQGWAWPSKRRTEQLVKERIDRSAAVYHREGREVWQRTFETPIGQNPDAYAAGECWESDHTRLDFFVRIQRGGHWVADRAWVTAWLDRRSRRLMGWHLGEHANSDTIRAALLDALRDETISPPSAAWLDNGKDFDSASITGVTKAERKRARGESNINASAWGGLLGMLGIEPHFALPYNHNGKARIERFFGTMHMEFDREFASWCGSKPGPGGGGRDADTLAKVVADVMALPTIDEAREKFRAWVDWYNARSEHSIEDLSDADTGQRISPDEFLRRYQPSRRVIADRGVLALLAQRWSRPLKVHKWGVSITHAGRTYRYGEHRSELESYVGTDRRVLVSFDAEDVSSIRVFDEQGRFLCVAAMNAQHGGLVSTPVSREALKRAHGARKAQQRRARERVDWNALLNSDIELAAHQQREMDIEQEKARQRELGIDADNTPALRIVRSPLDGQAKQTERAEQRKAVGAETYQDDNAPVIDFLSLDRPDASDAADDDGEDWEDEIDLTEAYDDSEADDHLDILGGLSS